MSSVQFKKRSKPSSSNIRPKSPTNTDTENVEDESILTKKIKTSESSPTENAKASKNYSVGTTFKSDRTIVPKSYAGDATYTTEIDTSIDRDARAIAERNLKLTSEKDINKDGVTTYQGQNAYKSLISKTSDQIASNKFTGTQGPLRAPSFLRATCRFDYAPAICKDYKETGFCGWGDTCIFLHDRSDYKSGWQLEKEWNEKQFNKKKKLEDKLAMMKSSSTSSSGNDDDVILTDEQMRQLDESNLNSNDINNNNDDDEDDDDDRKYEIDPADLDSTDSLPFACYLCRNDFNHPIVTLCRHYYCLNCIQTYEKTQSNKCPICDKTLSGVYNRPDKLLKRLQSMKGNTGDNNKNQGLGGNSINNIRKVYKKRSQFVMIDEEKEGDVVEDNKEDDDIKKE